MRFSLFALAALPLASLAKVAYHVPQAMKLKAEDDGCVFPQGYHVLDFQGSSNNTSKLTMSSFNFTFVDPDTQTVSLCQLNSSSVPTTAPGYTPKYACENRNIRFIWQQARKEIWLLEKICPDQNGKPSFEVSGGQFLDISCKDPCNCSTDTSDVHAEYASISPAGGDTSASASSTSSSTSAKSWSSRRLRRARGDD